MLLILGFFLCVRGKTRFRDVKEGCEQQGGRRGDVCVERDCLQDTSRAMQATE